MNAAFESSLLQVVRGTAALYKCTASITYPQITYPPTMNDAQLVSMVGTVAESLVGPSSWQISDQPSMAAEDFAWLASAPLSFTCAMTASKLVASLSGM